MWMLPDTKLRRFTLRAPAVPQRPRVPRLVARDSAAEVQDLPRQEPVQQRNGLLALARFDFSEGQRKDLFRAKYGRFPYHNSSRKKPPEGKKPSLKLQKFLIEMNIADWMTWDWTRAISIRSPGLVTRPIKSYIIPKMSKHHAGTKFPQNKHKHPSKWTWLHFHLYKLVPHTHLSLVH